jgi:hypothetical protein
MAKFDPHEVWRLVETEKVNSVMITGDAMGKPLIESSTTPAPSTTSRRSGRHLVGRALQRPVKDQFFDTCPTS